MESKGRAEKKLQSTPKKSFQKLKAVEAESLHGNKSVVEFVYSVIDAVFSPDNELGTPRFRSRTWNPPLMGPDK